MTVRELRDFLMTVDDDLEVIEDSKGELRRLHKDDIYMNRNTISPSTFYLDDEGEIKCGVLIFGAWS